jgi:hypothetical protein
MLDARTVGARRDIAAGEELTVDYALFSVVPEWRMDCHCGSSRCRGVVTGNDWRLLELQQRYAGHFSPFINARMRTTVGFSRLLTGRQLPRTVVTIWQKVGDLVGSEHGETILTNSEMKLR